MGLKDLTTKSGADNIRLFIYGCLITLVLAVFSIISPSSLHYSHNKSYDMLMRALPNPPSSQIPVIVGIDDQSLAEFGQWPWPRYIIARLIQKIGEYEAAGIGLDMIFPEPDRTSVSVICDEMARERGMPFSDAARYSPKSENDQIFANALRSTPSVLGYQFIFNGNSAPSESVLHHLKYTTRQQASDGKCDLPVAANVICSLPVLMSAVEASGFVNALTDGDGVIRRVPLIMDYRSRIYPSLGLACLIQSFGKDQIQVETGLDGYHIDWKDRGIPLDCNGYILVRYRGEQNPFPYVSAADILSGRISAAIFTGKIVFIGVTATGMGDWHLSPMNRMAHGMEVHASIVDSILTGSFIRRPAWAPGAELAIMAAAGLLSSMALAAGGALWSLLFTVISGLATGAIFYGLLSFSGLFLSPVLPLSVLMVNFAVLNTIKYGLEELKVRQRSQELIMSQDAAILSLSALVETRDKETGHHILRTQRYVRALARRLSRLAKHRKNLDDQAIELLYKSAPLHDIGKVGISDRILGKTGKLTDAEIEIMKTHTLIGGQTIEKSKKMLGEKINIPYLKYAYDMAISHHEKWDGSGYPLGLAGDAIPLSGRLMALADVYDALISKRVYKSAFSHEAAREIILNLKGRHFDPDVVDAFLEVEGVFQSIARELADSE